MTYTHTHINRRCPPTYVHPHIQTHMGTHSIADCNWQMSHFRRRSESRWGGFYSCHTCLLMPLHPSQDSCDHLKSNKRRDEATTSSRLSETPPHHPITHPSNLSFIPTSLFFLTVFLLHSLSLQVPFPQPFSSSFFFLPVSFTPHLRHIIDATPQRVMTGFLASHLT